MKTATGYTEAYVRLTSKPDGKWLAHPDMRPRLVEYAAAEGISMTEAIVKILSDKFNVPYETTQRKTTPSTDAKNIRLRIPDRLYSKLNSKSSSRLSIPEIIRRTLCEHFDLT